MNDLEAIIVDIQAWKKVTPEEDRRKRDAVM
jgi:hypothetical protein